MIEVDKLFSVRRVTETSPAMESALPFGQRESAKGKAIYINQYESLKFVGLIEFLPNVGLRGNHYHHKKTESLYIIEGKMLAYFWLPFNTKQFIQRTLSAGDLVTISPGLVHSFLAEQKTLVLELSPNQFDIQDVSYCPSKALEAQLSLQQAEVVPV